MEQTTSQPAYLYIPEPIEQQLAGYTLGLLLEVYKQDGMDTVTESQSFVCFCLTWFCWPCLL